MLLSDYLVSGNFRCPTCDKIVSVSIRHGKAFTCPKCGTGYISYGNSLQTATVSSSYPTAEEAQNMRNKIPLESILSQIRQAAPTSNVIYAIPKRELSKETIEQLRDLGYRVSYYEQCAKVAW